MRPTNFDGTPSEPLDKQLAFLAAAQFHAARHPKEPCEVLYGGAGGGGKTIALLLAALQYVDLPNYAAIIIRRNRKDMTQPGGILDVAHKWLRPMNVSWNGSDFIYEFPSGAKIKFGYLRGPDDIKQFDGPEYQFIGFDEVTQFEDVDMYTHLFSRLRQIEGMNVPPRVYSATNPGNDGEMWVMNRFPIDSPTEDVGPYYIPASMWDNHKIDREAYERALRRQNPLQCDRILNGVWGAAAGMAFPEYTPETHLFNLEQVGWPAGIPEEWDRYEAMDHGTQNPTSWILNLVDHQQNTIAADHYHEPGDVADHAVEIKRRREAWWAVEGRTQLAIAPPDIRDDRGLGADEDGKRINVETWYQKRGINFVTAQRGRVAGYTAIRERMKLDKERQYPSWHPRAGEYGSPALFFADHCEQLIAAVRLAPVERAGKKHAGNAIAASWEERMGHAMASLRYGCNTYDRETIGASAEPELATGPTRGVAGWPNWTPEEDLRLAREEAYRRAFRAHNSARRRRR